MSEVLFRKELKESKNICSIIDAFTKEFEQSLKLSCGELPDTKQTTLNFDSDNELLRVIKVRINNKFLNIAITNINNSIEDIVRDRTKYNYQYIVIIDETKFSIRDCIQNDADIIGISVNDDDLHIVDMPINSRAYNIYKLTQCMVSQSITNLFEEEREQRKFDIITQYDKAYYDINKIYHMDCMDALRNMGDNSVDFVLTDIPYAGVNKYDSSKNRINSKALRKLDKGEADELTFILDEFLNEIIRISSNSICIFCGYEQISEIFLKFIENKLTVRPIVWEKSQFSPMNGDIIYGCNVELAVWGKKHNNGVFNGFCKGTVFRHSSGTSKVHPTQKNIDLFKELILDNTNDGMTVLDPCIGSGTTALACIQTGRNFIGFERNKKWFDIASERISEQLI